VAGGETTAIERIRRILPEPPPDETWLGDDAAVLRAPPRGPFLLATDLVVEGVHVDLALSDAADVGWKALSVNVSDLAAMGGRPLYAVSAVAGPETADLDGLASGLAEAARAYACPVVGGDLSAAPLLVVSVAVTGTTDGATPVLRSGARPGDSVFVTGPLGASAAGLRLLRARTGGAEVLLGPQPDRALVAAYLRPRARVAEGRAARLAGATAMIDVSDGFALDLWRLADASGVGLELDTLPVAPGAPAEEALSGGEDYELCFTAPDPRVVAEAFAEAGLPSPLLVGSVHENPAVRRLGGQDLVPAGYEHPFAPRPHSAPG
jgi:thiamine-monophosphate kinase